MKPAQAYLPAIVTIALCALLLANGPIAQFPDYHRFADLSELMGLPHALDVLSNLGFAVVAGWGLLRLWPMQRNSPLNAGRHGYRLFLIGLLLTSVGSGLYHLAPDNARLVWDRVPIALACAGLLAAVRAECQAKRDSRDAAVLLGALGVLSVAWWHFTEQAGAGDLRPYLLVQGLPLVLLPMWQFIYGAPRRDKLAYGCAIVLYVAARLAELNDHALLAASGLVSGHTLKHLLATAAAAILVARLVERQPRPLKTGDRLGTDPGLTLF